jgi:hypothetical protein
MRRLFFVGLVISAASACVVGDTQAPGPEPSEGTPDAGGDVTPTPDAGWDDCEPPATVLPNGNHNAGANCQTCHNGNGAAPLWTVAGTIYRDLQGTAPVAGATIIVTDANGAELRLISASNGNFYTGAAVAFPVTVVASRCPDTQPMLAAQQVGSCNGCHGAGSRIHLP